MKKQVLTIIKNKFDFENIEFIENSEQLKIDIISSLIKDFNEKTEERLTSFKVANNLKLDDLSKYGVFHQQALSNERKFFYKDKLVFTIKLDFTTIIIETFNFIIEEK